MVIHAVDYSRKDGVFATSELSFYLGKNFLVTFHSKPLRPVEMVAEMCLRNTADIAREPDRVAHALLDSIVENYKPALDELAMEVAEVEQRALADPGKETLNTILQIKKEVLHLRQIIGPQKEVLSRFTRGEFKLIHAHLIPYYRDVYDGLFNIGEMAARYAESLTGVLQVYLNMSSNKTGEVVKVLTVFTVITTPMMLVGTWYGMNFNDMPEMGSGKAGYFIALGVTVAATLGTVVYFKLKKVALSRMPSTKSSFVEKVLGRIDVLDPQDLQSFVKRLARERSFLETLFNTVEDGVLVADANGRIIYLNDAVTRLTGYEEEMVMDQPVSRLLPDVDWDLLQAMDRDGGQGMVRREFELSYPKPRFIRLYAAPLDGEAKGSTGMALILHDATEAREQTHEAIESERIQATLLAASVAHELGNPLNALSIHLQLIEREVRKLRQPSGLAKRTDEPDEVNDIAAKLEKYIGVAKGEVNRLDYIVTQFLQAIRPSKPSQKKSSLNDTIEETVELLRPEFDNRGQALKFDLASNLPLAWFDAAQIKQSLINLMKNSMQAMTTGGELEIKTGEAGEGVWVSLTDSGGGIPQEQIKRIFEPYYTTKKKAPGLA